MELIIIGHILGDFYFQFDKMAENKKRSVWYMLLHCILYTLVMGIIIFCFDGDIKRDVIIALVIGGSHLVVDILKVIFDKIFSKSKHVNFIIDQVVHIIMLLCTCNYYDIYIDEYSYIADMLPEGISLMKMTAIIIAVLICWKPAAIFVPIIARYIANDDEDIDNDNRDDPKTGTWIGILEREIILILGLLGQYGAIGFVLTAKSLARYKQLEEKDFAERYLVGTLLSALIAIGCVAICSMIK